MTDLTKPVRRKSDGELVRILCTDLPSPVSFCTAHPIIIATKDGWIERKTFYDMDQDYENIPENKFLWLNVYDDGGIGFWKSREEAYKFSRQRQKFLLKLNTRTGETTIERKF